jgi:hypothetical protein
MNVLDKRSHSAAQLLSRTGRHLYQPEPSLNFRSADIAQDQISTSFPFLPPLQTFNFPPFWQPFSATGNYRLLVNRVAHLEEEIRRVKQKIVLLESFLHCGNISASLNCTGQRPISVTAPTHAQKPFEVFVPHTGNGYVISSQSASGGSSGTVFSSTYTKPSGSVGHGTVTVQHFGNNREV